ncbi:GGDEF domain-containing protein [Marinicellulosiphila megalodicopiae]|uniref:GGDEF domain-containing protein n=1 Tax=Marinicellulosiphila megalodicopiae TaxID=2724896 RepID=UPI003BAE7820
MRIKSRLFVDQYKQKYLDQLEQTDHLDAQFEVLRKALVHVSLIADGQDAKLDDYLGQLRKHLRSNQHEVELVEQQVIMAEKRMSELDHDKDSLSEHIGKLLHEDLDALLNVALNEAHVTSLKELKVQMPDKFHYLIEMAPWLDRFLQIKQQIDIGSTFESTADQSSESFAWDELFEHLFHVLDVMEVDEKNQKVTADIREELISGCDRPVVMRHVANICDVILTSHHALEEDFELYLQSLDAQLSKLHSQIQSSQNMHEDSFEAHDVFYNNLHKKMKEINHDVQGSEDPKQLKAIIQQKMQNLQTQIMQFSDSYKVDQNNQGEHYQLLVSQMTKLEGDNQKMREQLQIHIQKSQSDPLTKLPNRGKFDEVYLQEFKRYERYQTDCCIAVLDIDLFKKINDSYGHLVGDKVLVLIANQIKQNIRESDFVARYGGEEFVIILPHTELEPAIKAMKALCNKIANTPFNFKSKPVNITVSIGVCAFSQSIDQTQAFNQADQAMYQAKASGRNQVCKWSS